ncbi:hypothetical protein LCGC14_1614090, partial [marine sediment metagenome]
AMDSKLETEIDEAGRCRVFTIVSMAGWPLGSTPPKWVWREAVRMAMSEQRIAAPDKA